ncbi:hypothetical protein LHU53_02530 [Rhodoferax sp. U2-2l]|uniref:hypothetical protein n=1 Tax=Rhodoferax sp. U2-2l TaxID=2884000 RepID=UPI001D0A700F|nr:hypothetical protein [Rhodoferax sp. U2-2l]MCB8745779.1 hypothetical protein [Rhodoferax sp. U2-2l]
MNPMIPVICLLTASMGLGLWMGRQFLRRVSSNPIHIGFHLLLGVAGLEAVVMLMRITPDAVADSAGPSGKAAALVLALAVITGFATSVVARRWSRQSGGMVLATHTVFGTLGFVMFLAWAFM